jgi:hypothetical protein
MTAGLNITGYVKVERCGFPIGCLVIELFAGSPASAYSCCKGIPPEADK